MEGLVLYLPPQRRPNSQSQSSPIDFSFIQKSSRHTSDMGKEGLINIVLPCILEKMPVCLLVVHSWRIM